MEIVEKIHDIFLEEAKKSPILMSDLASMERYISESYTGRSLIELLQNADDACASKLIIKEIRKQVYLLKIMEELLMKEIWKPYVEVERQLSIERIIQLDIEV